MEQYQYMPGDPRLVDQLVYELKSKGIFDQFRKECISDVDTKPAYQNLRQRVESSVSTFLSRQTWKPDLNKNQLREKLRKHIMDGNYLEQGVERIVDQVVNPKVASMFIPQVEDLVYNYFGIKRTKTVTKPETSNGCVENDLLPTDLEAVSPGSVKSNDDKDMAMDTSDNEAKDDIKMEVDEVKSEPKVQDEKSEEDVKDNIVEKLNVTETVYEKSNIPLPTEEIKPEDIPIPLDSPPKVELDKIELPKDTDPSDIPLPGEILVPGGNNDTDSHFIPIRAPSEDSGDDSDSSDGSLRRNMSPLTPVRTFEDDSNDAQAGFDTETKEDDKKDMPISTFRFTIESKSSESSPDVKTTDKKEDLSYQFHNQVNINFNTPMYDDSSNSNNLHIDYESDANSKNTETKSITGNSDKKHKDSKKSHSHSSHRHSSSSKDKRTDSKNSSKDKYDSKRPDDKKSKDDHHSKSKSSHRERSRDRSDKKDSRESSKHRHSSSQKSSSRDSKSHRSSSSGHKHSSKSDEKKSSSKEPSKDKDVKSKDHKSSSKSSSKDKDRKSSGRKDEKKDKKDKRDEDHCNLSSRGNRSRRSTDRDSNDGNSSSSKGSNNQNAASKTVEKKEKGSKSTNTTSSSDGTSPSDREVLTDQAQNFQSPKPIRIESHLETPVAQGSVRFMPEVVLKKPKFASNFEEAKRMMKVRKFLDEEQRRMNQEAALLLEFQANVRPSLSQAYSNTSGPELEFACVSNVPDKQDDEEDNIFTDECVATEEPGVETEVLEETIENIADAIQQRCPSELVVEVLVEEMHSDVESQLDATEVVEEENLMLIEDLEDNEPTDLENKVNIVDEKDRLLFFTEQDKSDAVLDTKVFNEFLQKFAVNVISKMFLLNCSDYVMEMFKSISPDHNIVNFTKNGHVRKTKTTTINVDSTEVPIPLAPDSISPSVMFSPVKSENSFDLSSDYDTKLEEMVNSKSRQDIMEIILGSVLPEGSQSMTVEICEDEDIDSAERGVKRKICEVDSPDNNNLQVLTPNKTRRLSDSEIITSTTEESLMTPTPVLNNVRSKYLGKAKRVGLSRPKKPALPNSPSSDKSIENYEDSPPKTLNGQVRPPRAPQRYDSTDLYKPKLHYLSRRNNVT